MEDLKKYRILFNISLIFLLLSLIVFLYSKLKINEFENNIAKNKEITEQLKEIESKEKLIDKQYNELNSTYENKKLEFISKYGYDYSESKSQMYKNEKDSYIQKNNLIKSQIAAEISKYSEYYQGKYYESNNLDLILSKILEIKNSPNFINTNLYNELNIGPFIKEAKSEGTIMYLNKLNDQKKSNDVMLLQTAIYSQKLYEISNNLSDVGDNILEIYTEAYATRDVYKSLEQYGFNTANLSADKLNGLVENIRRLTNEYYSNKSIIDYISKEEKNENSK